MEVKDVMKNFETGEKGLNSDDADLRLKEYGLNKISTKHKRTNIMIFLEQFKSILVILLIFAMIVSIFLGLYVEALTIGLIIILNSFLGFYQEYKAEKAIEELKKLVTSRVIVIRDGEHHEISAERVVPGDIVLLEEGNRVPADMRLMEISNLKVDESVLTGESVPVSKDIKPIGNLQVPDRKNMVFMGTLICYGRGKGVVVSTGMTTEMGKIAGLVQEKEEETPLQRKLQDFGKGLGIVVMFIAFLIFLIGILIREDPFNMFLTAVSLAIAAVPEGLPVVVTLTLAIGTQKMLRRNVAIKRLAAVESLGSVTVICADKTGTMTTNEMTVREIWVPDKIISVTGVGFEPKGDFLIGNRKINNFSGDLKLLLEMAYCCNDSVLKKKEGWKIIGDPTEGALKVLTMKAGIKTTCPREKEIPFSSERKIMTTIHDIDGNHVAYSKGAPEKILKICNKVNHKELSKNGKEKIIRTVHQMASKGLRVLAFSYNELKDNYKIDSVEKDMTFVGLVAMIDPPRKETKEAVNLCKQAGIKVIMLTGDHMLTAKAVASEIGLHGKAITGEELDGMSDDELEKIVDEVSIFARVSPQNKLRIVETLKKKGHVVAVTGDGVNDAPALERAEVGIAMGLKGTDVAKESADMILLDDNFSTIVFAIKEGRRIYDNIKKFVKFLLSTNFGEMSLVFVPMILNLFLNFPLPLTLLPIQILWINLITDEAPALSLGVEPAEKDIMRRKPRDANESILHSSLPFILFTSFLSFMATMCIFMWELYNGYSSGLPVAYVEQKARTMAFTTMIFFQVFFVLNCKSDKKSVFSINLFNNKKLIISIVISFILQLFVIYAPFLQPIFGTVPLGPLDLVKILIFSSLGLFVFPEIFMRKTIHSVDYAK
jgi:Ca2+-transporting ATPase